MKKSKSLTNHSGFKGFVMMALAAAFGLSSCTDYDLDKKFPDWLGTSIYETLKEGFEGDNGEFYTFNYYVRLIDSLGQKEVLAKTGSKTLFVASDAAFERFFGPNCPFKNNGKPVTRFEELTKAQMAMIMNGSMLNNVYQVASLSTSGGSNNSDPIIGDCMRRSSASSAYDTIPILFGKDMPITTSGVEDSWARHKKKAAGIPILQDGTIRPIVFFVPKFLTAKKIQADDYDFLFNQGKYDKSGKRSGRTEEEASVNGVKIEFQNKKCFNGFVHVMEEVIYLLPNMAEYLASSNNAKIYSSILDRFCAPFPDMSYSQTVSKLIDQGELKDPALINAFHASDDTIYVKRYYSEANKDYTSANPTRKDRTPGNKLFGQPHELLKFDPGWNAYFTPVPASQEGNTALMQHNMSVMLVPDDATMTEWWLTGAGSSLRERYGRAKYRNRIPATPEEVAEDMDSVDIKVIVKLLNNNMLSSLVGSVPSKFSSVLNDANDPMFDHPEEAIGTVDSVVMCCNGAIYFTHAVYAPTAYKSVAYPTLVNEKLQIINTAIENKNYAFNAYLNSMSVPCYSFFVPVVRDTLGILNNKLMWVDPVSFPLYQAGNSMQAVVFSFDNVEKTVKADWYAYDYATGKISGNSLKQLKYTAPSGNNDLDGPSQIIMNRLSDLLNYHIIIGDIEATSTQTDYSDYRYFPTKGRGTVRFKTKYNPAEMIPSDINDPGYDAAVAQVLEGMEVAGGWQIEKGEKIKILQRFNFARGTATNGNGRTYLIDKPLQTSLLSVYDILSDNEKYPEFKGFFDLMKNASGRTVDVKEGKKVIIKKDGKPMFAGSMNNHAIGSQSNVSTLNSYHYTIYVPTNESIDSLIRAGYILPETRLTAINKSLDSLYKAILKKRQDELGKRPGQAQADLDFRDSMIIYHRNLRGALASDPNTHEDSVFNYTAYVEDMRARLKNFIKYHIQDNAVFANAEFKVGKLDDGTDAPNASYETAFMDADGQFTKLDVTGGQNITVTDQMGNTHKVLKVHKGYTIAKDAADKPVFDSNFNITVDADAPATNAPLWNIMCREYEYSTATVATAAAVNSANIETSSYVVIHQIDGPLMHESFIAKP